MAPMGLIIESFNRSNVPEVEFNDWYDLEHIPQSLRIGGFVNAQRWIGVDDPKVSAVTYDLDTVDVLKSQSYLAVSGENLSFRSRQIIDMCENIGRLETEQTLPGREVGPQNAGGMMFITMNILPEAEDEFNAWYDEEHIPRLQTVNGMLCGRRFKTLSGAHKYTAVYHLSSPEVQASQAWLDAITTPWQKRMRPLTRDRLRLVLRSYTRKV